MYDARVETLIENPIFTFPYATTTQPIESYKFSNEHSLFVLKFSGEWFRTNFFLLFFSCKNSAICIRDIIYSFTRIDLAFNSSKKKKSIVGKIEAFVL